MKLYLHYDESQAYEWTEASEAENIAGLGHIEVDDATAARWNAVREQWEGVQAEVSELALPLEREQDRLNLERAQVHGAAFIEAGLLPNYLATHPEARVSAVGPLHLTLENLAPMAPPVRRELYALAAAIQAGQTECTFKVPCKAFRPQKIYDSLEAAGLATLTGIYCSDNPESLLLGEVDLWEFSMQREQQMQAEFLAEHGLTGKSDDEIDDYLDEHELEMPKNAQLDLPSLKEGDTLRITGRFTCDVQFSIIGMAVTS